MLRLISTLFCFLLVLFVLISCSSIPSSGALAGATIIGEGADVFVFVPIQHNRTLLSRILPKNNYLEKALDRTDYVYASLKVKNKKPVMFENMESLKENSAESVLEKNEGDEFSSNEGRVGSEGANEAPTGREFNGKGFIPTTIINDITDGRMDVVTESHIKEENDEPIADLGEKLSNNSSVVLPNNLYINSSIEDEEQDIFKLLSYDVCAVGRYPKNIAGLIFNKRRGWQKQRATSGYKYYKKMDMQDAKGAPAFSFFSIPSSSLVLFSYNEKNEYKMENLLDRVDSPRPVRFGKEFELSIQQGEDAKDICIYVANPHFFLENLLAIDVDLPIDNLKVYLRRNTEKAKEFYNYKIILQMRNITAGFATRLLLSKLLKTQVRIEDNDIIVEKARVSLDRLVQIINKVLNRE